MVSCPGCKHDKTIENGHIHNGKQRYRCKACSRQFVLNPTKKVISEEIKEHIDKLLLEKIPLAGIARAMEVSETWLQSYVNQKYKEVPREVGSPLLGSWYYFGQAIAYGNERFS